jgi:hypothetical protein
MLHNEELFDWYFSPYTIRVTKSRSDGEGMLAGEKTYI